MIALLIFGLMVMKIEELIKEVKSNWDQLPGWSKLYFVFTTIVTLSSIASISDGVYKWKSFFLKGIEYYRDAAAPIKSAIHNYLGISLSIFEFDIFVLCFLFIVARRRFVIARIFKKFNAAKVEGFSYRIFTYLIVIYQIAMGYLAVGLLLISLSGGFSYFVDVLIGLWIYAHIAYPFTIFAMEALPKEHVLNNTIGTLFIREFITKKVDLFISYYGHIVAATMLLFIFAAINEGMVRQQ
jgi:hypothetical protein